MRWPDEKKLPVLLFLLLAAGSFLFHFNGLYGQDAHEYLRQCRVFHERLSGLPAPPPGVGDYQFGAGYPLAGAILNFLIPSSIVALQVVTWLSAALAVYFFSSSNRLLSHGAHQRSRLLFALLFISTPIFLRSSVSVMSDTMALALLLGAVRFGLEASETYRVKTATLAAFLAVLAAITRPAVAGLLLPIGLWVFWELYRNRRWWAILASALAALAGLLPHVWARLPLNGGWQGSSLLGQWSLWHLVSRNMESLSGSHAYFLPNGLFVLSPLFHIGFFLLLPALFFLFKKTDVYLAEKRVLLVGIGAYLLLIGGLPEQSIRYLLPVWAVGLLVLFPAWDRFVCYGFYFTKKYTTLLLIAMVVVQLAGTAYYLRSLWQRNQFETRMATQLRPQLSTGSVLYAMDVDIALRSYLPDVEYRNLWVTTYDSFPAGSYVLFNEPLLSRQWTGMNPMINWEKMHEKGMPKAVDTLEGGWILRKF